MGDEDRGLYGKYVVAKPTPGAAYVRVVEGPSGAHPIGRELEPLGACFVLRYDRDPRARTALAPYAAAARPGNPALAAELLREVARAVRAAAGEGAS